MSVVAGIDGWVVAAVTGEQPCGYAPTDWLRAELPASGEAAGGGVSITVETRLHAGGMMPWALLGARFEGSMGEILQVEVGHTADWKPGAEPSCQGPLGRPLVPALPLELARGAVAGLTTCDEPLPLGRVTVAAAGYDDVDSSFHSFDQAAYILRLLLPIPIRGDTLTKAALQAAIERCASAGRY